MKFVFLDFDGVLNCERNNPNCYQIGEQFYPPFEVDKVELLNQLLDDETFLCICSSWREQLTERQMELWLNLNNVKFKKIIHLQDPKTIDIRGDAIKDFIGLDHAFEYEFVILDDESWWYKDHELLKSRHIATDRAIGLTQDHIDQAKALFSKPQRWSRG